MSRVRIFALWALAAVTGVTCYRLFSQHRTEEIAVVVWMLLMVVWFHHEDWLGDSYRA